MTTRRRSAWPLIGGFVALAVLISLAGYWAWRLQSRAMQTQAERTLAAVGELKANQITTWLKERNGNAEMIRGNPLISAAVADIIAGRDIAKASADLQTVLDALRRTYGYLEVVMTSPNGAVLLRSPKAAAGPLDAETKAVVKKAAATGHVEFSDFHMDAAGHAGLDVVAPVPSAQDGGRPIAVVGLVVDPGRFLYPLIQAWPLPSRSGESLLVERRGDQLVYLNELRFRKNTALRLTAPVSAPTLPAAMAVRGRRGVVHGRDYRGIAVLAAIQPVQGTPWFIVAKEDSGEVLGPIRTRGWLTAGFTLILVALAALVTLVLWHARESQTSAEIHESEERYRALVDHAPMAIFVNREDRVVLANEACLRLFGATSPEQLLGKSPFELFHPDCHPRVRERIQQIRDEGKEVPQMEEKIVRLDGVVVDVEVAAAPFRDQGVNAIHVVLNDITVRKLAEAELREARDYLENLFGYANAPVIVWDPELRITRFNRAFEELTGRSAGDVIGEHLELLFPDDERRAEALAHVTQASAGERWEVVEIPILRADGAVRTVLWNSATVYAADGVTPVATIAQGQDITERLRAEEELAEHEDKFRYMFDHSAVPRSITQPSGEIEVNEALLEMVGYTREEIGERGTWQQISHPDDASQRERILASIISGERTSARFQQRYLHKNGPVIWADVSTALRRNADGSPDYFMTTIVDITERKHAEEEIRTLNRELEARVEQRTAQLDAANKELEAFAYSVSHDLRAPLRHISGFSSLLSERAEGSLDEKSLHYVDTISRSVHEMGVLIDDLLQFSRTGRAELSIEPVDMDATLAEALEPLQRETADRDIEWTIVPLPVVVGDHALLRQVWANLLGNAVKYSRGREPARIEVGSRDGDGAHEDVFWVRDNGVGFDMQYAHKLFGVFQRLHSSAEFEGTGIGLANVQRIINRLGGRVWAEAELDKGATFYFALPKRKEKPS